MNALVLSEVEPNEHINIPGFSSAEIDTKICLPYSGPECGACESACPVKGTLVFVHEKLLINLKHCVGCALCREACVVENKAINIKPL